MRLPATLFAALLLAACQPETAPGAPVDPTPEEMGQDDPDAPFTPAPVEAPRTYEPYSKTAMSFTPGTATFTPTPSSGPNMPPGLTFAFGNGYVLETLLIPGGAVMGDTPFDFSPFVTNPDGTPADASAIEVYSVETETVPAGTANGGFCDKTAFIAKSTRVSADAEDVMLIAFNGDQWPPAGEAAVCGTFSYTRAQ
jgi:hypothetical protein